MLEQRSSVYEGQEPMYNALDFSEESQIKTIFISFVMCLNLYTLINFTSIVLNPYDCRFLNSAGEDMV